MKLRTGFITACVEGKTVDGREITALHIDQMAQSYDPKTYAAHIWLEHLRGTMPDGVFKSLGDVVAVKVEVLGKEAGILEGKKALKVQLEPHPELVKMVRDGQKLHLSIEMIERLPATNGAYLIGVGVTDSPASLGTEVMQFSAQLRHESRFSTPVACDSQAFDTPVFTEQTTHNQSLSVLMYAVHTLQQENSQLKQQLQDKDKEIEGLKDRIPAPAGYFKKNANPSVVPNQEVNSWY
jgi:hypothetical protein